MLFSGYAPGDGLRIRLFIAPLSNPWTVSGPRVQIAAPEQPFELSGTPVTEAPEILERAGKINVIYSGSNCGTDNYALGRLTVAEDADLLDPATWAAAKTFGPVFQSSPLSSVYSPGHNSFFRSPDGKEDWIVYHAHSTPAGIVTGGGCFGVRTTRAQRFTFDAQGTPQFGEPVSLGADLLSPGGDGTDARQTEDAPAQTSPGDAHEVVSGNVALIGERGTELRANAVGDFVGYEVELARAGLYEVFVRSRTGPDRGAVALAGVAGPSQDLYSPAEDYQEVSFGRITLGTGPQRLRFAITGRNAATTGFIFAPDQIRFAAVAPDAAPRGGAAPPPPTPSGRSACRSRRRVVIRLRLPRRAKVRYASVSVNGRRPKRVAVRRSRVRVSLSGIAEGRATVRVIPRLRSGKRVGTTTRSYRTCRPGPRPA